MYAQNENSNLNTSKAETVGKTTSEFSQKNIAWYVKSAIGYGGPLTLIELQDLIDEGVYVLSDLVWHQGLLEWKKISEIKELSPIFRAIRIGQESEKEQNVVPITEPEFNQVSPEEIALKEKINLLEKATVQEKEKAKKNSRQIRNIFASTASLSLVAVLCYFGISKYLYNKALATLHVGEVIQVQQMAKASITRYGVRASASQREDGGIFVTSNLPDGETLEIQIQGVSSTISQKQNYFQKFIVPIRNHFGTLYLADPEYFLKEGQGDYLVKIFCYSCKNQFTGELSGEKFFMMGEKDQNYTGRLAQFHQTIKAEALVELEEIRQTIDTLEMQLRQSETQFQLISRMPVGTRELQWQRFAQSWGLLQTQMLAGMATWSDDSINRSFFYTNLHRLTRQAGDLIDQVNIGREAEILKATPTAVAEKVSLAGTIILAVRAKTMALKQKIKESTGYPPVDQ